MSPGDTSPVDRPTMALRPAASATTGTVATRVNVTAATMTIETTATRTMGAGVRRAVCRLAAEVLVAEEQTFTTQAPAVVAADTTTAMEVEMEGMSAMDDRAIRETTELVQDTTVAIVIAGGPMMTYVMGHSTVLEGMAGTTGVVHAARARQCARMLQRCLRHPQSPRSKRSLTRLKRAR